MYTPAEDVERFRLFLERVEMVNDHNARFAAGKVSYSMELNVNADKVTYFIKPEINAAQRFPATI